jgi:hypothetical protein
MSVAFAGRTRAVSLQGRDLRDHALDAPLQIANLIPVLTLICSRLSIARRAARRSLSALRKGAGDVRQHPFLAREQDFSGR